MAMPMLPPPSVRGHKHGPVLGAGAGLLDDAFVHGQMRASSLAEINAAAPADR
ncbi:hypothetical protein ACFCXK_31610 [Streptomyces sp. NPDC056269]|uniref:hypothetical protein n=1 Tax=Streptomyces sp. NPDC056269 TaxID=3345768 RepID=UPI0035DD64FF